MIIAVAWQMAACAPGPVSGHSLGMMLPPKFEVRPESLNHDTCPPAKALVKAMPPAMWTEDEQGRTNALIGGRKGNTERYKPGVKAMYLVGVGQI